MRISILIAATMLVIKCSPALCQTSNAWLISAGAFQSLEGLDEGYFAEFSSPAVLTIQPSFLFSCRPENPLTLSAGIRLDKKLMAIQSSELTLSLKASYFIRDDSYLYDPNFLKIGMGPGVRIPLSSKLGIAAYYLLFGYYWDRGDRFVEKNAFPGLTGAGELSLAGYWRF